MDYLKKQLKALQACCSNDATRLTLCGIGVEVQEDGNCVTLTATNAHVLLSLKNIPYNELRCVLKEDYGVVLIPSPEDFILFPDEKKRERLSVSAVFVDNYVYYKSIIPTVFVKQEYPAFGFGAMATVNKIYKCLGTPMDAYIPDEWSCEEGATIKHLNNNHNELLLVMPCRKGKGK